MNIPRLAQLRSDPFIARGFPFLLFIAMLMIASMLWPADSGDSPGDSRLWFTVGRGVIVALVLVWFWPSYGELRDARTIPVAHWGIAIVVGIAVFLIWIYFDQDWAVVSRSKGFDPSLPDGSMNWSLAILRLAGIGLVVPIMEELFWRSFVLRWIDQSDFLSASPRRVSARAFIITTVLFALEHNQWFAGAIAGAAYNWLYMRYEKLWVPIAAHAVTNLALGIWVLHSGNWHFW